MSRKQALKSSFRDPAGFLFTEDGTLYRQVNEAGLDDYHSLMESGLYRELVGRGWMVPHEDLTDAALASDPRSVILKPRILPYISYPYEWCFAQLRDAALLTLNIQRLALEHGMTLKDASAYNVQFDGGQALFIDTLSFEKYREGNAWSAYRQYCQHFLAPLALIAKTDVRLSKLLVAYIDGIPLDLASRLLPKHTWFSYSLLAHIHLHALAQKNFAQAGSEAEYKTKDSGLSTAKMQALVESLETATHKQVWSPNKTEWGNYYDATNYSSESASCKAELVTKYLHSIPKPLGLIQDLGANDGRYSRIAAEYAELVVSQDIDPVAVSSNYQKVREGQPNNILPLELDLVAPTPAIGWANEERESFSQRPIADVIMMLALVHHLALSNNLPLQHLAEFLARRCRWLIIEFVPKSDSQVGVLLASRPDIFPDYTREQFEKVFSDSFTIRQSEHIGDSERLLYLMESA